MKRAVMLLATGLALALPAAPAEASCVASLRFGGTSYFPIATKVVAGEALRGGVIPACRDLIVRGPNGEDLTPHEPDTPIALNRVAGVPAAVAVVHQGRTHLAAGYLAWDAPRRSLRRCGRAWRVDGTVAGVTPNGQLVDVRTAGGRQPFLHLTAATTVTGLSRHGYAYAGAGQRIRAIVRRCGDDLVALAIRRS